LIRLRRSRSCPFEAVYPPVLSTCTPGRLANTPRGYISGPSPQPLLERLDPPLEPGDPRLEHADVAEGGSAGWTGRPRRAARPGLILFEQQSGTGSDAGSEHGGDQRDERQLAAEPLGQAGEWR
jgi:hypothetical protein